MLTIMRALLDEHCSIEKLFAYGAPQKIVDILDKKIINILKLKLSRWSTTSDF